MTTERRPIVNQLCDDKGPLKGKGGTPRQWLDAATTQLSQLTVLMTELAAETRAIAGRRFGLQLYGVRGGRQLRWRFTSGRHATWASVEPELHGLPTALAQWYRQVDKVAQILNSRERALRFEVKAAERLAAGSLRQSARSSKAPVGRGVPASKSPAQGLLKT